MRKKSFLSFQEFRKQSIFKGMVFARRNKIQHLWLQDVGAGVNRITSDLIRFWFFQKPSDTAITFCFYQAIG